MEVHSRKEQNYYGYMHVITKPKRYLNLNAVITKRKRLETATSSLVSRVNSIAWSNSVSLFPLRN